MNAGAKGLSKGMLVFWRWWVGEKGGELESREFGSNGSKSMIVFVRRWGRCYGGDMCSGRAWLL